MECSKSSIKVNKSDITPEELEIFEESFLCGTATEINPVIQIDDIKFGSSIGSLTKKLTHEFSDAVHGKNMKYSGWLTYV